MENKESPELSQEDRAEDAAINAEEIGNDEGNSEQATNSIPEIEEPDSLPEKVMPEMATDARLEQLNNIAKKRKAHIKDEPDLDDESFEEETTSQDEAKEKAQSARKIRLKVDKQEIEMDEAEVIAAAQQHIARERRGNRDPDKMDLLAHKLDELSARQQTQDSTTGPETKATTPVSGDEVTDEMRELVDKIQTGDVDEGAQAIIELMKGNKAPSNEDVERTVKHVLTENQQQDQLRQAFSSFETEEPELAKNNDARDLIAINMMREMADEFVNKIGVNPDELAPYRNSASEMYRLHRTYVEMGHGKDLTPIADLLSQNGQRVKAIFKPKTETNENQETFTADRENRKRATSNQPSNAGASTTSRRRPGQKARPSRSEVIRSMQNQRNS